MEAALVLCTVPSEEHAQRIAQTLVEEHLAACISIVPGVRSIYRWRDRLCDDPELLLLIKTRRNLFSRLLQRIYDLHPYEVPEVQALEVGESSPAFLEWLRASTEGKWDPLA